MPAGTGGEGGGRGARAGWWAGVGRAPETRGRVRAGGGPAVLPATVIVPFMPASAWPGTEQIKLRPLAGTSVSADLGSLELATILVPFGKVISCGIAPSFLSATV